MPNTTATSDVVAKEPWKQAIYDHSHNYPPKLLILEVEEIFGRCSKLVRGHAISYLNKLDPLTIVQNAIQVAEIAESTERLIRKGEM